MIRTSIDIFGIRIDEPVTTLTDLLVAAVCFYAAFKIFRWKERRRVFVYLKFFFLTMGLATTIGGCLGHGFYYMVSLSWKLPGWLMSMFSIMLIERSSIEHVSPIISNRLAKNFRIINIAELCIFVFVTFLTQKFLFVEIHSAYGLLIVVASLQIFNILKTKDPASKYFLFAIAISAFATLIFINEIKIGKWFNHFDISHTLMAFSAYFFFKAANKLRAFYTN